MPAGGAASRNSRTNNEAARRSTNASKSRTSASSRRESSEIYDYASRNSRSNNEAARRSTNASKNRSSASSRRQPSEIHDSEYGGVGGGGSSSAVIRPTLTRREIERSFRILEDTRRQRRFEAKVMFKEYCLPNDKERMRVDQLKPYMARVFNTSQGAFEEEAVKLVLKEAKKKSKNDEEEDILTKSGVVSAVIKYGEYVRHWRTIQALFRSSDWSKDGKLQRQELRKLIEDYEASQTRNTEFVRNVLLFVTEEDLNFILETADENKDGDIDATEVVCAIGAWEELAAIKMNDFEKMNYKCCHKECIIS
mmetsp:Transcript_13126/g.31077  ORF Transcript_13126/g.31077 Transcript_13126/m.31077 type:complete len:309 (-) Transcript_13126:538-1464(-)